MKIDHQIFEKNMKKFIESEEFYKLYCNEINKYYGNLENLINSNENNYRKNVKKYQQKYLTHSL